MALPYDTTWGGSPSTAGTGIGGNTGGIFDGGSTSTSTRQITVTNHDGSQDRVTLDLNGNEISRVQIRPPRPTSTSSGSSGGGGGGGGYVNAGSPSGVVPDPAGSGLWGTYDRFGVWSPLPSSLQPDPGTGSGAPDVEVFGGVPYIWDGSQYVSAPGIAPESPEPAGAPDVEVFNGQPYIWNGSQYVPAPGITPELPQSTGSRYGTYAKNAGGVSVNYNSNAIASALSPLANALASRVSSGSDSLVDPNIAAREQAEINILNKRFELDKEMAYIDMAVKLGVISAQQGERMMDRAIDAAGFAANNRMDIAQFNRQLNQDRIQGAATLSEQIRDFNPAAVNAFLAGGGGSAINALQAQPEGALNDSVMLPAARTLQALENPPAAPAPFDPFEYMAQFQNAGGGATTGGGGNFNIPGFGDINLQDVINGNIDLGDFFSDTGPSVGSGGGTAEGGGAAPPARVDEPSRGITAAPAIARPGAADTQAVKIGTMQHPSNQNITWDVFFEPQTGREYYVTDSGRKEYLGGTDLAEGAVYDKDFQLMDAFAAGQGMTDPWAQSIAFQQAQAQLQRAGINANLSDIQSLIAQGYDPAIVLARAKEGVDLSQYVTPTHPSGIAAGSTAPDPYAGIYATNPFSPGANAVAGGMGDLLPSPEGMTTPEVGAAWGYNPGELEAALVGDKSVLKPPGYAGGTNPFMRPDPFLTPMGTTTAPAYIAGENGPELIQQTPFGDRVIPNHQLGGMMGGVPGYATGTFTYSPTDIRVTSDAAGRFHVTTPDGVLSFPSRDKYTYWRSQNVGTSPVPGVGSGDFQDTVDNLPPDTTPDPNNPGQTTGGTPTDTGGGTTTPDPANPLDPIVTPADQPYIDRIRDIREGVAGQYPFLNVFDPAYFATAGTRAIKPTQRNAFLEGVQTQYGIPGADIQAEAQQFRLPGVSRSAIRTRV